jgi:hypothetical protein
LRGQRGGSGRGVDAVAVVGGGGVK